MQKEIGKRKFGALTRIVQPQDVGCVLLQRFHRQHRRGVRRYDKMFVQDRTNAWALLRLHQDSERCSHLVLADCLSHTHRRPRVCC